MKCGFCAVQTLEPEYIRFIPIKEQIKEIDEKYGQKRTLLLMDNNVLKSSRFDDIIEEIKSCGFYKGATYKSPKSGVIVNRYVDFNQGLDAFLLDEKKAKKLSEIAIRPARIAFDHFEDKDIYIKAIELCAKYDILEMSNYILYNSDPFSGKGYSYKADTPKDFYERLRITVELKEKININKPIDRKISIFSFPMRYIPLQDDKRGYVGKEWDLKSLRAVQTMLIPTQGKGVSSKGFFEADFGKNCDEFLETLFMPEELISMRGKFVEKKDELPEDRNRRYDIWEEKKSLVEEWQRLYRLLGNKKGEFNNLIVGNQFNAETFEKLDDPLLMNLYLLYFSDSKLLTMIQNLSDKSKYSFIFDYCVNVFPLYIKKLSEYVGRTPIPTNKLKAFINVFGEIGIKRVLEHWITNEYKNDTLISSFDRCMTDKKNSKVNGFLLKTFKSYVDFECLSKDEIKDCNQYIIKFNNLKLKDFLIEKFNKFSAAMIKKISTDTGNRELRKQVDMITNEIYQQLIIINKQ